MTIQSLIDEHGRRDLSEKLKDLEHAAYKDQNRLEQVFTSIPTNGNVVFINDFHLKFENGVTLLFRGDDDKNEDDIYHHRSKLDAA